MAVKHDGSELYISDTHNDAIRLYIVEYHKMIDLAAGHYDSERMYYYVNIMTVNVSSRGWMALAHSSSPVESSTRQCQKSEPGRIHPLLLY